MKNKAKNQNFKNQTKKTVVKNKMKKMTITRLAKILILEFNGELENDI